MLDFGVILSQNLKVGLEYLKQQAIKELSNQGHRLTGSLERSFEVQVQKLGQDFISGQILQNDYGIVLDGGVSAENVPYSRNGGGGKSKYIEGLIDFFKKRGFSLKEAKNYAFATANKAKQKGHPTKPYLNNAKYSKNGRRTGWINQAYSEKNVDKALSLVRFNDAFQVIIDDIVNQSNAA